MRVALQIAYDGSDFFGYARQPGLRTVEAELLSLLQSNGIPIERFQTASRTDKHVSALCNVVAFDSSLAEEDLSAICHCSTRELIIYGYAIVDDSFYPRYASLRIYRYFLPKDVIGEDVLRHTLQLFTGEHDFSNFARIEPGKNPVRLIENIVVDSDEECFQIDFYARTFLWHQIRRIVSSVIQIAKDKITHQDIINALNQPNIPVDFGVAPSSPLVLKDLVYKDIIFHQVLTQKRFLTLIEKGSRAHAIDLFS